MTEKVLLKKIELYENEVQKCEDWKLKDRLLEELTDLKFDLIQNRIEKLCYKKISKSL